MSAVLRLYWRQLAMVLLIAAPMIALMVMGLGWLLHSAWVYPALIAMSLAGFGAALLGRSIRAMNCKQGAMAVAADSSWAPLEVQAWQHIQVIANAAQSSPPKNLDEIHALADQVVQAVSQNANGETDFAWARFTLPEILQAVQQACANLREAVRTRVPGSESITAADIMILHRFYARHERKLKAALFLRRVLRLVLAPQVAVAQELQGYATGTALSSGLATAQGWMARLLTEELGRSAINLYAGRYRWTALEASKALIEDAPTPTGPVPIRVLIAGQVNAGKSSLTNALLGSIKSPVSELPTPGGVREFRIASNRELDLVVMDTPGLTAIGGNQQTLMEACEKADLIIWVAQANNPARAIDVVALSELRAWFKSKPGIKPPPMALAMTHIDKISPVREWSPPYDMTAATSPKARNIRQALQQVAQTLAFDDAPGIPLALQAGQAAYNLDALWAVIATTLNQAQLTALDRELKRGGGFSLQKTFDQCYRGGRFMVSKLWADHFGEPSKSP